MKFDSRPNRPSDPRRVILFLAIGFLVGACAAMIYLGQWIF